MHTARTCERPLILRALHRLPVFVAAAAYLAAAVGGTGLHELTGGGHACCGPGPVRADDDEVRLVVERPGHDHAGEPACCSHSDAHGGYRPGNDEHDRGAEPRPCGTGGPARGPAESGSPPHDPHHCAVCQFLAMGQQAAEAPRPVVAAGAAPAAAVEVVASVGRGADPAERGRGPPAAV